MKNRTVGADSISAQKGITLVALVITIILLLILAGVVISLALGENGILQIGKRATEKHKIESIREEVELAMLDYKAKALVVDEEVTIESVLQELVGKEVFDSIDKPEQIGVVGEYDVKLKYNENHEVVIEYIQKATGVRITYKLQPAGYTNQAKVNIVFKVTGKVKSVTTPEGAVAYPENAVVELNYEVEANGTYLFKVENEEGAVTDKEVIVDTIDTELPVSCEITVQKTGTGLNIQAVAEDADATETSVKSGIDYFEYYLNGEKQESGEIQNLPYGKHTVYVVAYDKAGNSIESEAVEVTLSAQFDIIASGASHNLAVDKDGGLWAWGTNANGELGIGTTTNYNSPVRVLENVKFKHDPAVDTISAGHQFSLAIDEDGRLWSWGLNTYGQLGKGDTNSSAEPVAIGGDLRFQSVSAGNEFSVAIDEDGYLWGFGRSINSCLSTTDNSNKLYPIKINDTVLFKQVSAGQYYTLAIAEDNTIYGFGWNQYGCLGVGTSSSTNTFRVVASNIKAIKVSAGSEHSLAIGTDGHLYGWGRASNKGNGICLPGTKGDTTGARVSPVLLDGENTYIDILVAEDASMALRSDGTLWGAGYNINRGVRGILGLGNIEGSSSWARIGGNLTFNYLSAGSGRLERYCRICAIDSNKNTWTWGNNILTPQLLY